MMHSVIAISKV